MPEISNLYVFKVTKIHEDCASYISNIQYSASAISREDAVEKMTNHFKYLLETKPFAGRFIDEFTKDIYELENNAKHETNDIIVNSFRFNCYRFITTIHKQVSTSLVAPFTWYA